MVERLGLTWQQWADRVTRYLTVMEKLLWPNLIIVGGGVSEAADQVSRRICALARLEEKAYKLLQGTVGALAEQPTKRRDKGRRGSLVCQVGEEVPA